MHFETECWMSKKKESWAIKFAEFPDSSKERPFEELLRKMAEDVFGYPEITFQANNTDLNCLPTQSLHGLAIEAKRPVGWSIPDDVELVYEIPNIQLNKYMLREFKNSEGNSYYPKYGMLVNKENLILYENKFGKLIKIIDYTKRNNDSILKNTDKKLQIIKKIIKKEEARRDSLIVTVFNNKGGVGKSTISYGLAKSIADNFNKRVFAVDLDPLQADLSRLFKINNKEKIIDVLKLLDFKKSNIKEKLEEIRKDEKFLLHARNKIHVALSNPEETDNSDKSFYDIHKEITWAGKTKLKEIAGKLRPFLKTGIPVEGYDITILDAPAGWWFYSILAVLVSDIILIPVSAKSKSSWKNASRFLSHYLPNLQKEFEKEMPFGRIMPGPCIVNFWEKNSFEASHSATIEEIHKFIRDDLKMKGNKEISNYLFPSKMDKNNKPDFDDAEKTPTLSVNKAITTFDLQKNEKFKDLQGKEFHVLTKAIFPLIDKVID